MAIERSGGVDVPDSGGRGSPRAEAYAHKGRYGTRFEVFAASSCPIMERRRASAVEPASRGVPPGARLLGTTIIIGGGARPAVRLPRCRRVSRSSPPHVFPTPLGTSFPTGIAEPR